MARRNKSYSDFETLRTFGGKDCGLLASIAEVVGRSSARKKPDSAFDRSRGGQTTPGLRRTGRNVRTAPSTPDFEESHDLQHHHTTSSPQLEEMAATGRPTTMTSLQPKTPTKTHRKSRSRKFHKVFKNIPAEEEVIKSCSCAFFGDILLQGYLYISPHWFCFYTKILGHQKLIQIPVNKVLNIMRQRTAFIIPNAIGVVTAQDKYVFGSLLSRDSTYKLMCSVWQKNYVEVEPEPKSVDAVLGESDTNAEISLAESSNDGSGLVTMMPVIKVTPDTSLDSSDTFSFGSTDINQSTCDIFFETSSIIGGPPARRPSVEMETPLTHSRLKCFFCGKPQRFVSQLVSEVQSMPRTKLFLAICTVLFLFLLMCAAMLSYKIVLLQARIEGNLDWVEPSSQHLTQNSCGLHNGMYLLSQQQHAATVAKLHSVLAANINTLHNIHSSLTGLQRTNTIKCASCQSSSSSSQASTLSEMKEITT